MTLKPRLVRKVSLATITTAFIALGPGVAHAALVGNWQMTDIGAPPPTMTDTSGMKNNGTPSGGIVGNGNVFTFDGSGVVIVPDKGELDPGAANITITAVISFTVIPARDYDIVPKKPAGVKGMQYRMEIMRTGKATCSFTGSTGNAAITARRVLNDALPHTIACTKTSTTIGISVDGTVKTKAVSIGSIANTYPVSVGAKATGGDDFVGTMDSVQINYT